MRLRSRRSLATASLAVLLATGCTAAEETPDAANEGTESSASPAGETGVDVAFETLTGEATRLTVDAAVVDALGAVGVELATTGGATTQSASGTTTFVFPVTGGEATVDSSAAEPFTGTVEHEGGLQLSALGRSVTADQLVLDGDPGQLTAMISGRRVPLLPLPTEPSVSGDSDEPVLTYRTGAVEAGAVERLTGQLRLPSLPDLRVNELETTLSGS